MLKNLLLVLLLYCALETEAQQKQPIIKIYAYRQENYSGVNFPIEKLGDSVMEQKTGMDIIYLIYLEAGKRDSFQWNRVWISRQCYSLHAEKITTPIIQKKTVVVVNGPAADTLVKATKNNVYRLYLTLRGKEPETQKIKTRIEDNELVLEYTWRKKKYYRTVANVKTLEPQVRY